MNRFAILFHGVLAGAVLCAASPDPACGDEGKDERLARKLVIAAEKSSAYQETAARYRVMAEIAETMLQKKEDRADLVVEIGNLNAVIATFPQNRLRWVAEQWDVYNRKITCDQQAAMLKRQLEELDFRQQRMYEEELQRAKASKKRIRPIRREAILDELNRLETERDNAVGELKEGIESAAREEHATRRQVWQRLLKELEGLYPPPDIPRESLRTYITCAGGDRWLDADKKPRASKSGARKPGTGKAGKGSPQNRKTRPRSDDASF